ncbi:DegV family protein, partial [Chloroflexota bacterium]
IDSNTGTGSHGFLAMEAARAAKAGKNISEVVQTVNDILPKVKMIMALESLKYMVKGGRAPSTADPKDSIDIKPIIGILSGTGKFENISSVKGSHKAMEKLIELIRENTDMTKLLHLMVHYTDNIGQAEKLRDMITSQIKCAEVHISPFSAVVSCHMGPSLAVSFYS